MLDPDNDFDIFCLHYVFVPQINCALTYWKNVWVRHPIRSEHNMSPEQLWAFGLESITGSEMRIAQEIFHDEADVNIINSFIIIIIAMPGSGLWNGLGRSYCKC